jgi:hypothetical protein
MSSSVRARGAGIAWTGVRRATAILAGAFVLAMTSGPLGAAPTSARTFDSSRSEAMVLQPASQGFACAMKRVLADRWLPCR